jgi:hypothetical protein
VIEKPHRFLLDRVSSYGEEGKAYLRRRKMRGRPFARVWFRGGREVALEAEPAGDRLTEAAGVLIDGERRSREAE